MSNMPDQELVDALCDIEEGLSEWEVEFVDSLSKWMDKVGSLTDKQRTKAEQIWNNDE